MIFVAYPQAAYLTKKLQAAKSDFAAADAARQKLVQRDREVSVTIADMHHDMVGHVVCLTSVFEITVEFPCAVQILEASTPTENAITWLCKAG